MFLLLKARKYNEALEIQIQLLCRQWKEGKQKLLVKAEDQKKEEEIQQQRQ